MRVPVFIMEPRCEGGWRAACAGSAAGALNAPQRPAGAGPTLLDALASLLEALRAGSAPAAPALECVQTPSSAERCVLATIDPAVEDGAPAFVYPCDRVVLRPGRGVLLVCGSPALSVMGSDDRRAAAGIRRVMGEWFAENGLVLPETTALGLAGPDRLLVEVPAAPALIRAYRCRSGAYKRWFQPH